MELTRRYKKKITHVELEKIMNEVDLNGDGQLSFDEFKRAIYTGTLRLHNFIILIVQYAYKVCFFENNKDNLQIISNSYYNPTIGNSQTTTLWKSLREDVTLKKGYQAAAKRFDNMQIKNEIHKTVTQKTAKHTEHHSVPSSALPATAPVVPTAVSLSAVPTAVSVTVVPSSAVPVTAPVVPVVSSTSSTAVPVSVVPPQNVNKSSSAVHSSTSETSIEAETGDHNNEEEEEEEETEYETEVKAAFKSAFFGIGALTMASLIRKVIFRI